MVENKQQKQPHLYIIKTILSLLLVLAIMPLGHASMILMEHYLNPAYLHTYSFILGFIGFILAIIGVFVSGDTKQTLYGLFGALLFWTGWVEFLFQYYAQRYHVIPDIIGGHIEYSVQNYLGHIVQMPQIVGGETITKPEYLILPATFGLWAMMMLLYLFSARTGCNFLNWIQRAIFRNKKNVIVARPMTRHTSIVTFMEFNMIIWSSYLLLMFCYDPRFIGDTNIITYLIGLGCFIGSLFMVRKQLHIGSWGHNIRFSIATIIVFWTPIEIMSRVGLIKEFWLQPTHHIMEMSIIAASFILAIAYIVYQELKK